VVAVVVTVLTVLSVGVVGVDAVDCDSVVKVVGVVALSRTQTKYNLVNSKMCILPTFFLHSQLKSHPSYDRILWLCKSLLNVTNLVAKLRMTNLTK